MQGTRFTHPLARLGQAVVTWSPVWASAILLWQILDRGLGPARAEARRLEAAAPDVEEAHEAARETFEWMASEAEAWTDPVYQERRRRLRREQRVAAAAAATNR